MEDTTWAKVPVGLHADRWETLPTERKILFIAHTVTAATRLLDVLPAFDSDFRVQIVFTTPGTSAISRGVRELLTAHGEIMISWTQALHTPFDLAITASHSGNLHEIQAPLVVLSHGVGYTKYSAGSRKPEAGSRKPEAGSRKPEAGSRKPEAGRSVYGLSAQWLTYDGHVYPSAIALSHDEQLDRLTRAVPAAVDAAAVIGDPCYDRILASTHLRGAYREALGVLPHQRLIVVSSTWASRSLFGSWPDLFRQLMGELSPDLHRVLGILHPNLWHGHGTRQVHSWLADCLRAGLTLVPPEEGWRAALIAADCFIGDHGAVTTYGTALDKPLLLASFPASDVAPDSPVELLGHLAPRLDRRTNLRTQIDRAIDEHRPGRWIPVSSLISSAPGRSLRLLRTLMYDLMSLPEPPTDPPVDVLPLTGLRPTSGRSRPRVSATYATGTVTAPATIALDRQAADVLHGKPFTVASPGDAQLSCHRDHPTSAIRTSADIVFRYADETPDSPEDWARHTFDAFPGCVFAVTFTSSTTGVLIGRDRGGLALLARTASPTDPTTMSAALYAWLAAGNPWPTAPLTLTVQTGPSSYELEIALLSRAAASARPSPS